ncbi:MAG: type II toxin-antitoxin system HicA family toxin [Thermomicrobiales bacterium]
MPPKIRELEKQRKSAGFVLPKDRGKGSHRIYGHSIHPELTFILSGRSGDDADWYQLKDVRDAIQALDVLSRLRGG